MRYIFDRPPVYDPVEADTRTPELLIAATALAFGLDARQLRLNTRRFPLVHARHVAIYLIRELTDLSWPEIGRTFGGQHHTTALSAHKNVRTTPRLMAAARHVALTHGIAI